jgi:hypothetical protein
MANSYPERLWVDCAPGTMQGLERLMQELRQRNPGIQISRSSAVRWVLEQPLADPGPQKDLRP